MINVWYTLHTTIMGEHRYTAQSSDPQTDSTHANSGTGYPQRAWLGKGRGPPCRLQPEIPQTPHALPYGLTHNNVNDIDVRNSALPSTFSC